MQEAVTRQFELSGKPDSGNGKYNESYRKFYIAHNAMLSFLKSHISQVRFQEFVESVDEAVKFSLNRRKRRGAITA